MKKAKSSTLRGRPGGILWLMGHELRLYWRRGKMKPRSGLIVAAILLGVWSLITWTVFHRFGADIPPPPFNQGAGAGFALAAVSIIIVFIASVMTSGAILGAVDAIYTRNDLDLLLSSPLSPWRVLVVRASAIAIGALPVYAGFLVPPLLWLTLYSSPLWLTSIIFLLTLAFVATGLALLIVTGLFRLIGPRNTRVLAQIVSALTGGAIFILFQWFNLSSTRGDPMSQAEALRMIAAMNIDPHAVWLLPARAMTGDVIATLVWVIFAAILFSFGVYIFSRSFVSDAAAALAMGRKKRTADTRIAAVRGGVMRSVIRKELRLLVRDPLLLSQIGLQLVYIFPLAFVLLRPGSDFQITEAAFAPALTLLSSTLAGSLIWITASAEDAPDLIASAPAPTGLIDRAKLFAAISPVILLMAIPIVALLIRDTWAGSWTMGGVIAGATCAALIGLWRRNPGSRRDFVRRRQGGSTLTALGKGITGMALAGAAAAGAYGYPWIAIIPAIIALAILGALYKPTPKFVEAA
jgi:ABC-2 type transport system permease protein